MSLKFTTESCIMTGKDDAKYEEQMTFRILVNKCIAIIFNQVVTP